MANTKLAPIYVYHAGFLLFTESAYLPIDLPDVPESSIFSLHAEKIALTALALERARDAFRDDSGSSPELGTLRTFYLVAPLGGVGSFRVFLASEEERAEISEVSSPEETDEFSFFFDVDETAEEKARDSL